MAPRYSRLTKVEQEAQTHEAEQAAIAARPPRPDVSPKEQRARLDAHLRREFGASLDAATALTVHLNNPAHEGDRSVNRHSFRMRRIEERRQLDADAGIV